MWMGLAEYQEVIKRYLDKHNATGFYFSNEPNNELSLSEMQTLYAIDLMLIKKALMDAIIGFNLYHLPYEEAVASDLEEQLIFHKHQDFMVLQNFSFLAQIDNIATLKAHQEIFESLLAAISYDFFCNWFERVIVYELIPNVTKIEKSPFWVLSSEEAGIETDYTEDYLQGSA